MLRITSIFSCFFILILCSAACAAEISDEEIKKNVVEELYGDDRVDAANVRVEVNDGEVILQGEVPTYLAFTSAHSSALQVEGVTMVDNRLTVNYPTDLHVPSDEEIEDSVRNELALNPDIDILDLEIEVSGGIVTLRGTVDAFWKKNYAEELVAPEPGVLAINNHLAIVPTRDIIDEDIAEEIMRSLEARAVVSAEEVTVTVEDGEVELTGTVDSWLAKESAYNAAEFTAGVTDVKNYLTITDIGS